MARHTATALLLAGVFAAGAGPAGAAEEPFVVGTKPAAPFVIRAEDGTWTGVSIELWEEMAAMLDIDYEIREYDIQGLMNAVASGEVDVAAAALTVTSPREARVDFTHPFYSTGLGIAARTEGSGWLAVLRRFVSAEFLTVVLALGLVLLLSGLLVWLFERKRNPDQFGGATPRGIGSGFWWAAVTMTTVGYGDKAPATLGGRLVALVWMFASLIIISAFTAAIASALTVGSIRSEVRGPDDLDRVAVASVGGTTSGQYLEARNVRFRSHPSVEEALGALRRGEVEAVVYDAPILRYLVLREPGAGLLVLPGTFERQDYAFALPPGSPRRERMNQTLLEILDAPRWQEILRRYLGS